uniref:Selenocysteine lyase n=1 Tax=Lygus hesperus TaxID=30085 RepID=A0A146LKS8_LYGHE
MAEEKKTVYLDYNATTPYDPAVQQSMITALSQWGNPSSSYKRGKIAKEVVEKSRESVANMIGALASEIIFMSGGTEANNTAIRTVIREWKRAERKPHIISTKIEHDATLKLLEFLLEENEIRVTFLPTNSDGSVDPELVGSSVEEDTVLVTLMLANNETGSLLDLKHLCNVLKEKNQERTDRGLGRIHLHIDAAQALGKIPVSVVETPVDYLTIVGHKFYGPRIGALYVKEGLPLHPLIRGGGQEKRRRPGTENTVCIAGLGEAAKLVTENLAEYNAHLRRMKDHLREALLKEFPKGTCVINFPETREHHQLPNTLSVSFPGLSGNRILANCPDLEASTGAACHSSANCNSASAMLLTLLPEEQAIGTMRLSVGRETTVEELDLAVKYLREAVDKMKSSSFS